MSRDNLNEQSVTPTMEISTEQARTNDRGNTWHLAHYRNGKLHPIPATAEGLPVNGAAFPTKGRTSHAKKRLEPLPKGGFKIVMRPRDGMDLGRWKPFQINEYLARATGTSSAKEMSNKIQIQINSNQNILAIHTEDEETARALTRVHQLTLGGKSYPSYTYLAAPDDSIKGVIHDVKPGSTTEELLDFIRVGNGPQVITARMLGQSSSALITFEGRKLPSYVIYSASRQRVLPYRPPRHICARCLREGHRADVCPTPNIRICTQCATQDPTPDHACTPKCVLCDGQHPTGDRMCQRRYNDHQSKQDNTAKRTAGRKSRSRSRARSRGRQSPAKESREKSQGRSQTPQQRGRTPRHRRSQTPRWQSRSRSRARRRARQSPASESREKSQGRSQTPQQRGRTPRHQRSQTPRGQSRSKTRNRSKSRDQSHTRAQVSWAAMLKGSRPSHKSTDPSSSSPKSSHPHSPPESETVPEWARILMNMLTRITSRVDRIEQQLMSPEIELKSPAAPPAQPEDAQQTIARLQETIARLQEQLRAATEKEQMETLKKARKTDVRSQPYVIPQHVNRQATYIQPATLNLHTAATTPILDDAEWTNTEESLGSDHSIIEIEVAITAHKKFIKRHAMTDWEAFRKARSGVTNEADDLERWVRDLQADAEKHTKHVNLTSQTPDVDSRLLHLWEAKRSLLKRWKRQRLNRKLKLRIARLEKEALEHAEQLGKNNWHQNCNELQGTLGTAKTWSLLRHLIDPSKSKSQSSHTLRKIVHDFPGKNEEILRKLKDRYIGSSIQTDYPDYNGEPNTELDAPLSETEVIKAAQDLTRNTSPGRDGVENRLLRNLDEESFSTLTQYLNRIWDSAKIPAEWKHAEIVLISKPGKTPSLENLRPISLTSCLGKLLEHVVLNRLQPYLEKTGTFSYTMFGFRSQLSTQDILLQLKEDILDNISRTTTQAVLALDIKGAFDNVSHTTVLQNLASTNCGQRTYEYVRDFLKNRTATIGIESIRPDVLKSPEWMPIGTDDLMKRHPLRIKSPFLPLQLSPFWIPLLPSLQQHILLTNSLLHQQAYPPWKS
ncbi:hypothetical protein ISCGN_022351 [Ixodes scapularis]